MAVVACTGPNRAEFALAFLRLRNGRPPQLADLEVMRLCEIVCGDDVIDEALVLDRPSRATLELHVHGSEAVLRALEAAFGPFRAVEPTAAERLLGQALVSSQLELALEQLADPFAGFLARARELPRELASSLAREALARAPAALAQSEPARLVLCGAQNAGKSTLMNRLLLHDRVLTGALPGLTRDPVEEVTTLSGYPYRIVDTAGEGPAADPIDRQAQDRARAARVDALRLLVVDGSVGPRAADLALADQRTLWVRNKSDLPQATWPEALGPVLAISCRDPYAALAIRERIGEALRARRGLAPAGRVGGPAPLDRVEFALLQAFVAKTDCG